MIKRAFVILLMASSLAVAGEKIAYQDWVAELSGKTNEAYTIADPNTSFGTFCSGDQCLFYLHQSLNCTPGAKYSVLMNSSSVSTALTMECTVINGNIFQILTPFNAVLQATQAGDSIGFAVALQSGAFAVTRFSLLGAKPAIDRMFGEASGNKHKGQNVPPAPPQILIVPPIQIVPQVPQNRAPNNPPKSASPNVSI
ncbi:hypothetical protein G6652_08850 [Polynucleobacter paneuropaeus]|jgi:hypothetical protein|nr:hypothetical protein [Polynucleobacter paneuropaeus]MBT8617331.1 hypothetical protein [Polynucleobacter paneuropaeus]MBT8619212.1 hypothetical protein [Polynucleobacter paneuropaeus]MBT8620221.1 hypothetical protein [Polynucleobacter paneuropaeus]MBT8626525.1 hypothetical protein [Polynucleobacter paneuropaeus]